jgi:hypothetical protein
MPWDDTTQEYYPGSKDRRPTRKCVMCGQVWDEENRGRGGYVEIGESPVCDEKCKWEFIEEEFTEYLRKNNIAEKLKAIATNPSLDAVSALRKELWEWAADEAGAPADTNLINGVLGPLFDAEDVLKRGLTEYLPECLQDAQKGVAEALAPPQG